MYSKAAGCAVGVGLFFASLGVCAQQYKVTDLGTLGGTASGRSPFSIGTGINASGQVTGYSISSETGNPVHAFITSATPGPLIDLGAVGLNLNSSEGYAINASGQVTGYSVTNAFNNPIHAFVTTATTNAMTDLGTLACGTGTNCNGSSYGTAINDSGQVTGYSSTALMVTSYHAFITKAGSNAMSDLSGACTYCQSEGFGINASGQVTGWASSALGYPQAFITDADTETMTSLGTLGGTSSMGYGINASGQVTGESSIGDGASHAFLYSNGTMVDLGTLGGSNSQGNAINDIGQVVGTSLTSGGVSHAFLYSNRAMIDLNAAIGSAASTYTLTSGQGINNTGQIIVNGTVIASGDDVALLLTPVQQNYQPIPLGTSANVDAIATSGQPVLSGGLDGHGYALPESLLGPTLTASGTPFALLSPNTADAASGGVLAPPSAYSASSLQFLAVATNGNQANQQIAITYTDQSEKVFTQSFSDWGSPKQFPGESVAASLVYRLTPTGTEETGPWHVYEYTLPLDPTRQVAQVTLPHNRNVAILSMVLSSPTSTAGPVPLGSQLNSYGLSNGGPSANPGLDGHGYDYAVALLGSTTVWSGVQFQMPQIGTTGLSTVVGTIYLPYGYWAEAYFLATAYNGSQSNKPVVVTYNDGSQQSVVQSFSDWGSNQHFPNESVALTMPYRYRPDGTQQSGPWYLYGYSVAFDPTKIPISISLPGDVKVLALSLQPPT